MGQKSDTQLLIEAVKNADVFRLLFERMPQGEGSGLDADMVDGYHATDLIRKCQEILVETDKVIHGIGSGAMSHHGNEWHSSDFKLEADFPTTIVSPSDGQFMCYKAADAKWENFDPNVTVVGALMSPPAGHKVTGMRFTWNPDGTVKTIAPRDGATDLFTVTFIWNPDGTIYDLDRVDA